MAYLCEITSGKSRKVSLKDEYIYTRASFDMTTNTTHVVISRALFFWIFIFFNYFLFKKFFFKKKKKKTEIESVLFFYILHSLMIIRMLMFLNDLFIGIIKQLNKPVYGSILRKEFLHSIDHRFDMVLKERLVSIGHPCKTFCE